MASGTAFRCKVPNFVVLPCDRERNPKPVKLYKAPPNKVSKCQQQRAPFLNLPLEILNLCLLHLDLASIGMLRRVNKTTRIIVESLPEYSLLKKHASDTLRLMSATECSQHFPIAQLYDELCHPWCRTCGEFGPFLYFPTLTRSCFKCNYLRPEYELARVSAIRFNFALSKNQIKALPIITALAKRRMYLADITQAKALAWKVHGGHEAMKEAYNAKERKQMDDYLLRFQKWEQNGMIGHRPRLSSSPRLKDRPRGERHEGTMMKMWATAPFPYWDQRTRTLEPGVYCRACSYYAEVDVQGYLACSGSVWDNYPVRGEDYHRAFLEADIPGHFLNCPAVKKNYDFEAPTRYGWTDMRRKEKDFIVTPRKTSEN